MQWLTSHQKVVSSGIGVIAVSKGTENALLMGAYSPKVSCCFSSYFFSQDESDIP